MGQRSEFNRFVRDKEGSRTFLKAQHDSSAMETHEHMFSCPRVPAGVPEMTRLMATALGPILSRNDTAGPCRILDVGFGDGGAAIEFAERYDADILGVDINPVGWDVATKALEERNDERFERGEPLLNVNFTVDDIMKAHFETESFDAIYSRDTLLFMDGPTKEQLLRKFYTWLAPGGMICIVDHCLGRNAHEKYIPKTVQEYHLWSQTRYVKELQDAGFSDANGRDLTLWYCMMCQREMDSVVLHPSKNESLLRHGNGGLPTIEESFREKIDTALRGDRSYIILTATKEYQAYKTLRQQLVDTYVDLSTKGLIDQGSISTRVDRNRFLITPTVMDTNEVTTSNVVLCDRNGNPEQHDGSKPSSETNMHCLIFQKRPDVGAIVHSHSVYACALACCQLDLPVAHQAVASLLQDPIPRDAALVIKCSQYFPCGTMRKAAGVVNALGGNHGVILANDGAVSVGPDLKTALYRARRLDRECEIYWRMKQLGVPRCLSVHEIEESRSSSQFCGLVTVSPSTNHLLGPFSPILHSANSRFLDEIDQDAETVTTTTSTEADVNSLEECIVDTP